MKKIIFCIYHRRDHEFYLNLAKNINNKDLEICLLYFMEVPQINHQFKKIYFYDHQVIETKKKSVPQEYLFHEKICSFQSKKKLHQKYSNYKLSLESILKKNNIDLVIQELGGFVCHLSMYEATRVLNIKHIFIEPSFLKGHCYFLLNTLKIDGGINTNTLARSKQLLLNYYKILNKYFFIGMCGRMAILKFKNNFPSKNTFSKFIEDPR